jgi:hypothetical protein
MKPLIERVLPKIFRVTRFTIPSTACCSYFALVMLVYCVYCVDVTSMDMASDVHGALLSTQRKILCKSNTPLSSIST